MALSSEVLNCFVAVETHLSGGSSDGVEMFVQSTVACFNVEDASVVHLVLDVVAVKMIDNRKLIGSYG